MASWFGLVELQSVEAGTFTTANHPVSLTRASVFVSRDRAIATIDVFVEDLRLYHDLEANSSDFLEPDVLDQGIKLHEKFLAERIVIQLADGTQLVPDKTSVEDELPAEGVALAEMMAHQISYTFEYSFEKPPEFLTFQQRLVDEDTVQPSELQLRVKQESAAEPTAKTLLPREPFTIRFNWTDTPLSADASEAERTQWMERARQETLGITSYSSVYTFLYIEDWEIRHEILIPLLTLEQSVLLARDDDSMFDLAEQEAARPQIEAYFRTGNPIRVNGRQLDAKVDRIDFYGLAFKDFALRPEPQSVPVSTARVGVILRYPIKAPAESLQLVWNRFSSELLGVVTVAFFDTPEGPTAERKTLTRLANMNTYQWTGPPREPPPEIEPVPVVYTEVEPSLYERFAGMQVRMIALLVGAIVLMGLGLVGLFSMQGRIVSATVGLVLLGITIWMFAFSQITPEARPKLEETTARDTFAEVQQNLYRAFVYRDENRIYDALAKSVEGDLLQQVYLEVQRSRRIEEQGGAVSRIRSVELLEGHPTRRDNGFSIRCSWTVAGTVEHWGHVHQRTNRYEGVFDLAPVDRAWKLTDMNLLGEERLTSETSLRKLGPQ